MKWFIFRVFVTYFFLVEMKKHGYSIRFAWAYSDSFQDYFETAEWTTLMSDAEFSVYEDFSYWTD